MYFSDNILVYEINQFFKLKETSLAHNGKLSTVSSFKIGAIRNYSYGSVFDEAKFDKIFRLETEESLIKSLVNKRIDLIVGNDTVIKMLAKKMGVENLVEPLFPIVSKAPLYIGFSKAKSHKKLSEDFSKALYRFRNGKTYKNILRKYLDSYGLDRL